MKDKQKKKKKGFSSLLKILKDTIKGFSDDKVLRLSASLAYATLFSIIPLLSLLITIGAALHIDIANQLFTQLQTVLGTSVVDQLRNILESADRTDSLTLAAIVSLAVSIFGATTIFAEIQDSLNTIWGIKTVPKKGWLKYIKNRLLSFSVILIFAFILLITFSISNIIGGLSDRFMSNYPDIAESLVKIVGVILNVAVTVLIFILMFKMLPDAKIKIKDVFVGAFVTTILFLIGQWAISLYIDIANVGSTYGVAAFMIIIITWIYYSAIIIYIGAEFTQAWANEKGSRIIPDEFAVATKTIEVQEDNKPLEGEKKVEIKK